MKTLASILLGLAAIACAAQPPAARHIDFTQVLVGLDGKPLLEGDPNRPQTQLPVTLHLVCQKALADNDDPATDTMTRWHLAEKIYENKAAALNVTEIALLK